MKYLPFEKIVLKTTLNKVELAKKLSNHRNLFSGKVSESGFHILRVISYQNSFLPQIIGEINETDEGCLINIKFRLHRLVLVFMCIWMGFVSLACIGILFYVLNSGDFSGFQFIPFACSHLVPY